MNKMEDKKECSKCKDDKSILVKRGEARYCGKCIINILNIEKYYSK